ncbi:MAG: Crp/Fnr family transcriptional regulator [Deltaproteobacteria bacterium]|jgi:CRP/FNR family transcriptional regulator|nr:Crp/Fnr family transcriptional regulator [Deltaproteobacteria bacterium]
MMKKLPMFSEVSADLLTRLKAISKQISVRKGALLFSPGDAAHGFFAVLEGAVRVYRVSPKGKEISFEIACAGQTFAEASLFSDEYRCCAQALKESTVCLIRKDAFLELIRKDPQFATDWLHFLSLKVIHLHQRIEEVSLKPPGARIASYILFLSEIQNSQTVALPVHKKSIATLLGMTHETFYRTAKELEDVGMVRFDGQKIDIMDRSLLEGLVE